MKRLLNFIFLRIRFWKEINSSRFLRASAEKMSTGLKLWRCKTDLAILIFQALAFSTKNKILQKFHYFKNRSKNCMFLHLFYIIRNICLFYLIWRIKRKKTEIYSETRLLETFQLFNVLLFIMNKFQKDSRNLWS